MNKQKPYWGNDPIVITMIYSCPSAPGKEALLDLAFALHQHSGLSEYSEERLWVKAEIHNNHPTDPIAYIASIITTWTEQHSKSMTLVSTVIQTQDEYDRSIRRPQLPALVGISEIAAKVHVTKQRASQLATAGIFGPPVARLGATPVWVEATVDASIEGNHGTEKWNRRPGRPRKPVLTATTTKTA
jgi:hypothetical protein